MWFCMSLRISLLHCLTRRLLFFDNTQNGSWLSVLSTETIQEDIPTAEDIISIIEFWVDLHTCAY